MQRLLNRFLMRGFQTDEISRAAVVGTHDDTAKLILLGRLSLYGHSAARLHDEVLAVVAEWYPDDPSRKLHVLGKDRHERALADLEQSPVRFWLPWLPWQCVAQTWLDWLR